MVHKRTLDAKEKYEGAVFKTNNYGDVEIVEYINSSKVKIRFINTNHIKEEYLSSVRLGCVRDDSIPTTCGFGFFDVEGASIGRNAIREYRLWNAMINRCYNENLRHKNPTYKDCTASDNFKYLPYFEDWCSKQTGFDQEGWHLDKDILIKGNKIYSENTCCFVPSEVNKLFIKCDRSRGEYPIGVSYPKRVRKYVAKMRKFKEDIHLGCFSKPDEAFNAYKEAKEAYIKEVANKWKDQIDLRVYEALMKYRVEITD